MAQTLINVNQNQLNNQTGSYVELIKTTQQAKEGLAQALVNKGANVTSSSTFTDMITAVNNLATISGSFTAVKGNYRQDTANISNWSRTADRATNIISNSKGSFAFTVTNSTTLRIASLNGYDYDSNSTTLLTNTLTIDTSAIINSGTTTVAYNFKRFFMKPDGSKLWCISADGTKINEYTLDYSGVDAENPVNITITLAQSLVMASTLNNTTNTSAVLAVNDTKKKVLIFDPASALSSTSYSITANSYIIDYSNGITGLTKETVSGDIGNVGTNATYLTNFPLGLTENVLYQSHLGSLVDIVWDENRVETHKQILSNMLGIQTVFSFNGKRLLSYVDIAYDATKNQQVKTYIIDLDTYEETEYTYFNYGVYNLLSSYNFKTFCLPQKIGDAVYLTGAPVCSYVKLTIENNEIVVNHIPSLTFSVFTSGNDKSLVGQTLYDGNNNFFSFRISAGSAIIYFAYHTFISNKLIAYTYNDENNNHISFTPYDNTVAIDYLDYPEPEILVGNN